MLKIFCDRIDFLNKRVGEWASWLVIPLTLVITLDVILRYIFNSPTIWAWDVGVQLLGALSMLGGGYALLYGAHIGIDVLVEHLSPKRRAIVEMIIYLLFFFSMGILLWKTLSATWLSVQTGERSSSFLSPPVYPLKIVMTVGVSLLLLQGLAKFVRLFLVVKSPESGGKP